MKAQESCSSSSSSSSAPERRKKRNRKDAGRRSRGTCVYDSTLGITCHFCRQKTVDKKVWCHKCVSAFCRRCLRTRHGEDLDVELRYGRWICPKCRGGCGPACKNCCNCGPCRAKDGLLPPKILVSDLSTAGFDNVHDYLIHLKTKESPQDISARKSGRGWCKSAFKGIDQTKSSLACHDQDIGNQPGMNSSVNTNNPMGLKDLNVTNSLLSSHNEDIGSGRCMNNSATKSNQMGLKDISASRSRMPSHNEDIISGFCMNNSATKSTPMVLQDISMTKSQISFHNRDIGGDFTKGNSRDLKGIDAGVHNNATKSYPMGLTAMDVAKCLMKDNNNDNGYKSEMNSNATANSQMRLKGLDMTESLMAFCDQARGNNCSMYNSLTKEVDVHNKATKSNAICLKAIDLAKSSMKYENQEKVYNSEMCSYANKSSQMGLKGLDKAESLMEFRYRDRDDDSSMYSSSTKDVGVYNNASKSNPMVLKAIEVAKSSMKYHNQAKGCNTGIYSNARKNSQMSFEGLDIIESLMSFHDQARGNASSMYTSCTKSSNLMCDHKSKVKTEVLMESEVEHDVCHMSYARQKNSKVNGEMHIVTAEAKRSKVQPDFDDTRSFEPLQNDDHGNDSRTCGATMESTPSDRGIDKIRTGRNESDLRVPICFHSRKAFECNLKAILSAPFNPIELKDKWENVRCRRMVCKSVETGVGTSELPSKRLGLSYIDHYPDFASRLTANTSPEEKLRLLRGFFFWLEHAGTSGAFKPWVEKVKEDPECIELDDPDCEILREVIYLDEDEGASGTMTGTGNENATRPNMDFGRNLVLDLDDEDMKPTVKRCRHMPVSLQSLKQMKEECDY